METIKKTHQSHHRSRPNSRRNLKPATGLDRFLNSPIFVILGSSFLLLGTYSALSASIGADELYAIIKRFLIPEIIDIPIAEYSGNGLLELCLYFIPTLLLLTITWIFSDNKLSFPVVLLSSFYLIYVQIKISYFNYNFGGCYYPNFIIAVVLLWLTTILLLGNSLIGRKSVLLIFTVIFFYSSIMLLGLNFFFTRNENLIAFVLIFCISLSWVATKIEKPVMHLVNFAFGCGYLVQFWLRTLVVRQKPAFLTLFLIFEILCYLLFYSNIIIKTWKKENQLPKWLQLAITGLNLAVLLGTTYYVFVHYFTPISMGLFVSALLLVHLGVLYLINKYNHEGWKLPHYFTTIVLAALVLPLLLLHYRLLIFSAVLSVLMLWYAIKYKEKSALGISFISLLVMAGYYLFIWIMYCIPALFASIQLPDPNLLGFGLLAGLIVVAVLLYTTSRLQKDELPPVPRSFKKQKYDRGVRIALHIAIFLTMGWLVFSFACSFSKSLEYNPLAWYVAGVIFFVNAIRYYAGLNSIFKKPILYIALGFIILYPAMVHLNMTLFRSDLVMKHDWNPAILFLHYLSVILVVILGRMIIKRVYWYQQKMPKALRALDMATVLFILFLVCTEYDNLSVIITMLQNVPDPRIISAADQYAIGKFLPYSIITWILAGIVFVRTVRQRNIFLRNFSITLFSLMLVKLFAFDFETISEGAHSIMFLLLGLFLMGFAFIYPKLLKGKPILPEFKRRNEGTRGDDGTKG